LVTAVEKTEALAAWQKAIEAAGNNHRDKQREAEIEKKLTDRK
jgi:hypothetical protein